VWYTFGALPCLPCQQCLPCPGERIHGNHRPASSKNGQMT